MVKQRRKTRQTKKRKVMKRRTQRKRRQQKRRQQIKKGGGTNPFSEVTHIPGALAETIKGGFATLAGNETADTVRVTSLPTDQPFLKTDHISPGVGPKLV